MLSRLAKAPSNASAHPGRLPFGQTPALLRQPHPSRPWNPLVAGVFYRTSIIERWGSGTTDMIRWCEEGAAPPPTWSEWPGAVVVTFLPARPFEEDAPEDFPSLSALQASLLRALDEKGVLSVTELLGVLDQDVARRTLQENLAALQEQGLVELVGRGRSARWQRRKGP